MSNQEANEYMRNVRWSTARNILVSTISLVLTGAGGYYGLKGDIKDSRAESKEQIRYVFTVLNNKIDSLQRGNVENFKDLASQINGIPPIKNTTIIKHIPVKPNTPRLYIEKWVNGKLAFIPVD